MESWNILDILPPEVMILVFSNLEPEDIVSSLSVSKLWNALHNGFNWKEAFKVTFGELPESVDLSQKLNWRKLFFDCKTLSSLTKSRRKFKPLLVSFGNPKKTIPFSIELMTKDNVLYKHNDGFYLIDLRALKDDPSISKEKLIPSTAVLPFIKGFFHYNTTNPIIKFSGSSYPGYYRNVFLFWNFKKGSKALPSIILPSSFPERVHTYTSHHYVNSKYFLWKCRQYGCLIDTTKRCYHYCNFEKRGQTYERENYPSVCENKEKCAVIETWDDYDWYPFLSEQDPDLIVGIRVNKDKQYELVQSRIGQQKNVQVLSQASGSAIIQVGSEHVIKSRRKIVRHWFSFEINADLYFIDLMDTSRKIKMSLDMYDWIPNESKVILWKKNIIIVYDLENALRCSKMTFKDSVLDFSILPSHGFIAVLEANRKYVTICHLETAMKGRSIDVSEYKPTKITLVSEKLLLITNGRDLHYLPL